jgi:hypothetical protein
VEGIERVVVWVLVGIVPRLLRFVCWGGSSRLITSKTAEPNAFARSTVWRLKFADRTFSAKRRERIANRSGGSSRTTNAAPGVR